MVKMTGFEREAKSLKTLELEAFKRVQESGWYVLGNEVDKFEGKWAQYCGANFCSSTANGMDAIEIILRVLGIGAGDEVITTSMTAQPTVLAILRAGARPVLADIDIISGQMSYESASRCISKKTKAILLVHLYGEINNIRNWMNLCEENSIYLVEDCAQAHLSEFEGTKAGSFGIAGAFSFYPTKNLGYYGDAGAIITNSKVISEQSKILRNYGQSSKYKHEFIGLNSRMDEVGAAVLTERLNFLVENTERRRQTATRYRSGIDQKKVTLLKPPVTPVSHVYHQFVILCDDRERMVSVLKENSIESAIHYPIPMHKQLSLRSSRLDSNGLNNSEEFANSALSIPCHPFLTSMEIDKVINVINSL